MVIAATVINVLLHLLHKDRTAGDYVLAVLNIVLCVFAVFCLVLPGAIEPYVRAAVGAFTIGANLVSLVEVLRYENKKSWRFIEKKCEIGEENRREALINEARGGFLF